MRQLRVLGLLCPTILIIAMAFGAAQASASRLVSPEIPSTFTTFLKAAPTGLHKFSAHGMGSFDCNAPQFSSSMSGTATSQFTAQVSNDYACAYAGPASVKMNGCSFTFRPGAEESPGVFGGSFDIGPAGCGPLTVKYMSGCEAKIYPKTGLAARFSNHGEGKTATVLVQPAAGGLKTERTICGSGSSENGIYTGSWEMAGYTDAAATIQTGISVTSKAALYLSGEPTRFNGEAYPEAVRGAVSTANVFTTPNGKIDCKKGSFDGTLAAASTQLTLAPTYSECMAFGSKATVKSNGCSVVLSATSASSGTASIACPVGKAITVEPMAFGVVLCTLSFPAQSLGSVTYESVGTGIDRRIVASISGSGIQYSSTGGNCGASGSKATFSGGIELQGAL
jgi:hypothetical protein